MSIEQSGFVAEKQEGEKLLINSEESKRYFCNEDKKKISDENKKKILQRLLEIGSFLRTPHLSEMEEYFLMNDRDIQSLIVDLLIYEKESVLEEDSTLSLSAINTTLKNIQENIQTSYFIKKKISYALESENEQFTIKEKRDFIKKWWDELIVASPFFRELAFSVGVKNGVGVENESFYFLDHLDDSIIEDGFREGIYFLPEVYRFEKFRKLKTFLGNKSSDSKEDTSSIVLEEEQLVSKISMHWSAVYDYRGNVKGFISNKDCDFSKKETALFSLEEVLKETNLSERVSSRVKKDYIFLIHPQFKKDLEKSLAVRFGDLHLDAQLQFLSFICDKNELEVQKIFLFVSGAISEQLRNHRLRSFLSLEQGGEAMGAAILEIGEKLPCDQADEIFRRYAELADVAESITNQIRNEGAPPNEKSSESKTMAQHILEKAKNMLVETAEALQNNEGIDTEVIAEILKEYREDILRTSAICKTLPREAPIEAIEGLVFEKRSATKYAQYAETITALANDDHVPDSEDTPQEIKDLRQIFRMIDRNYAKRGAFRDILKQGLAKTLLENAEHTTLYTVRQNERILALARFEDRKDGTKYFGSFNVLTSAQQSSLSPKFFRKIIEEEGKESDIEATCDAFSTAAGIYIEEGRFEVYEWDDREETPNRIDSEPWFRIRRIADTHRQVSVYEKKSLHDLRVLYEEQSQRASNEAFLLRDHILLHIPMEELRNETSKAYVMVKHLINQQHYSLTRFVRDGSSGLVFCALERRSDAETSDSSDVA
jgi:hypothetical protein